MKVMYKPEPPASLFSRPSLVRRVAADLKGVGWDRSLDVSRRFCSVAEMVSASEKDWLSVPGIGKKLAKSIMAELGGNGGEQTESLAVPSLPTHHR